MKTCFDFDSKLNYTLKTNILEIFFQNFDFDSRFNTNCTNRVMTLIKKNAKLKKSCIHVLLE